MAAGKYSVGNIDGSGETRDQHRCSHSCFKNLALNPTLSSNPILTIFHISTVHQ